MNFDNEDNIDYQLNKIASIVIKEKRNKKGYSLEELANKLNNIVTRQSLYRYENNEARMKNNIFKKICLALDENPSDIWEEINNRFILALNFDNAELIEVSNDTVQIPVLGTIKAGIAIEAQEDIIDYIDIPKDWLKGGKSYYGLKISGDSMYPKYLENDVVIFEQSSDYEIANKKDCAVMVNGFDATFKNITISENGITLVPLNLNNSDGYQPTFYNKEQIETLPVKIIGIAREKRTKL